MADGLTFTTTLASAPDGSKVATDDAGAACHVQIVKLAVATDGSATALTADNTDGLLVNLGTNNDVTLATLPALVAGSANIGDVDVLSVPAPLSTTGTRTEATALRVTVATDSTGVLSVDDNGASLTVDNAQLSVVGSGTEATAMRVTLATDSTGLVSVDDNGGSPTVDYATTGSGTATGALRVELPTNGTGVIATVSAVTAITNALPAGTNAIGKLAANSGVDIGDVDVTSIAT